MFENFCAFFNVTGITFSNKDSLPSELNSIQKNAYGFSELFNVYEGNSFGKGMYRLHYISEIDKWNEIICSAFPEFIGRISCFGYDWLGRQFALDSRRLENGQPQILMFEPGTGEVLEIPCSFLDFHEAEIPSYNDACLASEFFKSWIASNNPNGFLSQKCVGYKVLLFLGGKDSLENLEVSDMEVYWTISAQLLQKTKSLPLGTKINVDKLKD